MIDRLITFSIRNRFLVIVAGLILALWGVYAVYHTPVDAIPDLSENQVIVFTEWMGHSPREIEDQITYPLTLQLQGLAGVRVVRSSSDPNFSMINVILEDSADVHSARQLVVERLTSVTSLPGGVTPLLGPDAVATGQIYWYTIEGGDLDLGRLRAVQDWYVRPQLSSVPGVAEVASVGGYAMEYQVEVDPLKTQALGVAVEDVIKCVGQSNSAVGAHVLQKGNAEYIVRATGRLGEAGGAFDLQAVVRDLEAVIVPLPGGKTARLGEIAHVTLGPQLRRGVLEKDGSEVTGGVVLLRQGENPLEVTRRIKQKIEELAIGLPAGVRIVPFYDRTPLIEGAIHTVTGTLLEAIITATICVVLVLVHLRTSFIIAVTLPLATLASFAVMWSLRKLGIADIQTNVMSLAGIAISIGVLVDASIVMAENVMHALKDHFGESRVQGDIRHLVLPACLTVGRPIFFSVVIMLLSFLPVFALGGISGKMFHPLAFTKSFALVAVAVLAVTLVPALCTIFIKGRLRKESESWIVRSVLEVYRPVLGYVLNRPGPLVWFVGVTFLVGLAPLGNRWILLGALFAFFVITALLAQNRAARIAMPLGLVLIALCADLYMQPLAHEYITPLDEGMTMDMPISWPRASITQSTDDLKARDMVFCRFPEVDMVVGKAGRAETPTDPAPLEMIETMVNLRPQELWPKRKLRLEDAQRQASYMLDTLEKEGIVKPPADQAGRAGLLDDCVQSVLPLFDAQMREFAYQRNQEFTRDLQGLKQPADDPRLWAGHLDKLNGEIFPRAVSTYTRLVLDEFLGRLPIHNQRVAAAFRELSEERARLAAGSPGNPAHHHHGADGQMDMSGPAINPQPELTRLQTELSRPFAGWVLLWQKDRTDMVGFGGELDRVMQMPGWTNVWTMPIQNRVDMLSTGVNTAVGIRVLGRDLENVVRASHRIAEVVGKIPGAASVITDPVKGKGYVDIHVDRAKAAEHGLNAGEVNDFVEAAVAGRVATTVVAGRERYPVRVRYQRAWRDSEESLANLALIGRNPAHPVPLGEIARIEVVEGPATIKSENGLLRDYVRLNVHDRGVVDFVEEARRAVASEVVLPPGVFIEWTGQFEHEVRAFNTLLVIVPIVVALIFLILYWTYHDLVDAALMLLAVPGAIAGGVFFQWLFGYKFSLTVWIGYIACFGMATSTGIIMLVYLREAVAKAGGLANMTVERLHQAVMDGAVHRLRPKLLTEGTIVLGLAPMLWATGTGAEIIRPMAAPVLGGILVADEVIDLLLPVLFYHVRRRRLLATVPLSPSGERG
jgi:Cu(I)/Ag(I) efflux system membrane protein CusA/SilA